MKKNRNTVRFMQRVLWDSLPSTQYHGKSGGDHYDYCSVFQDRSRRKGAKFGKRYCLTKQAVRSILFTQNECSGCQYNGKLIIYTIKQRRLRSGDDVLKINARISIL